MQKHNTIIRVSYNKNNFQSCENAHISYSFTLIQKSCTFRNIFITQKVAACNLTFEHFTFKHLSFFHSTNSCAPFVSMFFFSLTVPWKLLCNVATFRYNKIQSRQIVCWVITKWPSAWHKTLKSRSFCEISQALIRRNQTEGFPWNITAFNINFVFIHNCSKSA